MIRSFAALAALMITSPVLAQPKVPPITAPTADPAADAELVACATYLAAGNAERMEILAEADMMEGQDGARGSANEIAAMLATECEAKPDSLVVDVFRDMVAR